MNNLMLKLHIAIENLIRREEGQDLVEYALVVALIAFAATAGMKTLASDINSVFTMLSGELTSATS
jgi:pilus assembly protein Flp/PilA